MALHLDSGTAAQTLPISHSFALVLKFNDEVAEHDKKVTQSSIYLLPIDVISASDSFSHGQSIKVAYFPFTSYFKCLIEHIKLL